LAGNDSFEISESYLGNVPRNDIKIPELSPRRLRTNSEGKLGEKSFPK
jgi:hypothetical protein